MSPSSPMSPPRGMGPNPLTSFPFLPDFLWICMALVIEESFCQCPVCFSEDCSACRCHLDVFVKGSEFHILLLHHLHGLSDFHQFCTLVKPLGGFPDNSVGKESACIAGDPSSIPGLERSTGEGIGYPLQYSWASLVAQLVKNLPVMWKTWVRSLGWEDLLEKGKATHSSILAQRIPWTVQSMGSQRVRHDSVFHFH